MKKILGIFLGILVTANCFAATVYIEEYTGALPAVGYQAAVAPGAAAQTVAIGGASTQSSAFVSTTRLIRVHGDSVCSIEIGGKNPTATATSARFIAGQTEYFLVSPAEKLPVFTN